MGMAEIVLRAKEVIEGMSLTNDPSVYVRKRPRATGRSANKEKLRNGVTVVPLERVPLGRTNERETWGYRIGIYLKHGTSTDTISSGWLLGDWEDKISRRFASGRLLSLSNCELHMTVSKDDIPEDTLLSDGEDVTYIVATVMVREPRIAPA